MYLKYFGFSKPPFDIAPNSHTIFPSHQHAHALTLMDYAIWNQYGFMVVTGKIGTGKTTLINRLIAAPPRGINFLKVSYTNVSSSELFDLIASQLGLNIHDISKKIESLNRIHKYLKELEKKKLQQVFLIDEAQNLTLENLEDVRMLTGLEGQSGPLLKIILVGQPELGENIKKIPQLEQRVLLSYYLSPLSNKDVSSYIAYRLRLANANIHDIFSLEAVNLIAKYSGGIPRLINKICDAALICAFADGNKRINSEDVENAIFEVGMTTALTDKDKTENASDVNPEPHAEHKESNVVILDPMVQINARLNSIDKNLARIADVMESFIPAFSDFKKPNKSE